MDSAPLSSAEKKELRGIGQRLKPHVNVGKQGMSENVCKEIDTALIKNGLIKIRFEADRTSIKDYCIRIAEKFSCEHVGSVGKTAVFFREMPAES